MIKIKKTGEEVVIIGVTYHDVKVVAKDRELPVVLQYKISNPKSEWTDYVRPDQLVMK